MPPSLRVATEFDCEVDTCFKDGTSHSGSSGVPVGDEARSVVQLARRPAQSSAAESEVESSGMPPLTDLRDFSSGGA